MRGRPRIPYLRREQRDCPHHGKTENGGNGQL